jgi:GNAT superfamily N-acetyltransferase
MQAQPNLFIPLLVRRYVAWTERNVRQQCVELRIGELEKWQGETDVPEGIEILSLPQCGSEWLLRRMFNQCFHDCPGFRRARYVDILALRSSPHHDPSNILVARAGKRHAGFCIGRLRAGGRGLVNGLGVHPDFRGQGIGRGLLRTALTRLQAQGASEAMIRVHPDNAPAKQLYRSEGFLPL